MTTTLSEGVKVPDVGSVNWAGDLEVNWNLLNGALANLSFNVKLDRDNIWTGEQSFTLPIVGSITGTASKAIADEDGTSIKTGYVNVAGNQTVTGDKSWTGSNTFNNILPNATNSYTLGSSSYQWSSVYAQSYYYNGTAWGLDKANVWTGNNTYTTAGITLKNDYVARGTIPSVNRNYVLNFTDSNNDNVGMIFQQIRSGSGSYKMTFSMNNGTTDHRINFFGFTDGSSSFIPEVTNTTDLGSSTNKWKTLNGINPGALSLPGDGVEVDRTNWVYDGVTENKYTPQLNGWLQVRCADAVGNYIFVASAGKVVSIAGTGVITSVVFGLNVLLPVIAGNECSIRINCAGSKTAYFYPCLGNV